MNLAQLAEDYALVRGLSLGAAYLLRWTVQQFSRHLGRGPAVDDLTDRVVSAWLAALESGGAGPWTRNGHRTRLLCLWRFAARRGLCSGPGEVRREPAPDPQPVAWTPEQVGRLLDACGQMPADEGQYLRVLISAGYESGLRRGDLWGLHRDQIGPVIRLRQSKTGRSHEPCLRPETVAAILARPGTHPLACPWGPRKYARVWARLRLLAGLDDRGGLQQLRRTGATWVAVEEGLDAAREFLGHRSPEMVNNYVDRRHYRPRGHLPPPVGAAPLRIADAG
jgi:integrase